MSAPTRTRRECIAFGRSQHGTGCGIGLQPMVEQQAKMERLALLL